MKIALIITLGGDLVRSTEHLGIGYIVAVLREQGYPVDIFEIKEKDICNINSYEKIVDGTYDVIGFTTTCITMKNVNNLASLIREVNKKSYIVYGGHMATFWGKELFETAYYLDCSIIGEGEYTFVDLVKCLETNGDLSTVKGIIYRQGNEIIENEGRELIEDLDTLPYPVRDQFEQKKGKTEYLRLSTSRGCYGSCGFCSNFVGRKQKGMRWRGCSPKRVVDEIEMLSKKYDFKTFDFVDSTFEDPGSEGKVRIRKIAQEIIDRKLEIYYNCCFRAENWKEEDEDLLRLLVQSGLEKVNIGFESGNDRGLKILNKRASVADNYKVIEELEKFPEIYLTFGFIMLHPYSTIDDMRDNAVFLHNTGFSQVIRHYFWILEIYPGTLLERKLKEDNLLSQQFDINDGMYRYIYQNKEVECFKEIFTSMLELRSIWDFEIFDILVHTFIVRLKRKFGQSEVIDKINEFNDFVITIRKEMTDFNFNFFINLLDNAEHYDTEEQKKILDDFILRKILQIKGEQYKLGRCLLRKGYILSIK